MMMLVTVSYATITINVNPQCTDTDQELIDSLRRCAALVDLPVRLAQVRGNPDDGRSVRASIRADEGSTLYKLSELYGYIDDWMVGDHTRIITTVHIEEFSDTDTWPEDEVDRYMKQHGWVQRTFSYATPNWIPNSLVQSFTQDAVNGAIFKHGGDPEQEVMGMGMDVTMTGYPQVTAWMTPAAAAATDVEETQHLCEELIDDVADQVLLRHWLQSVYASQAED